jgi:uncharacterized membrane protein
MRNLLIIVFLANVILTVVSLFVLPSEVAVHFGRDGMPDSWVSKEINTVLSLGIDLLLFIVFFAAPSLSLGLSPKWLSLPNKNYWLQEENRGMVRKKLVPLMTEYGIAVLTFLLCVGLLTLEANLADPVRLNESIFFPIFVAFMLYTGYWCVTLVRVFRIPKNSTAS